MDIDKAVLDRTLAALKARLLESRLLPGWWQGRLSSSALSTATAVFALASVDRAEYATLVRRGLDWLTDNQNSDGGWGDTVKSISNISTTMLCWSALSLGEQTGRDGDSAGRAESWLADFAGSIEPDALAQAVDRQYGRDHSFSAPILTMCALAGRLGEPEQAWRCVKPLPFELAVLPHRLFKWLRLPVVSYALPALIAIGQVHYHHRRPGNPLTRAIRHFSRGRALDTLRSIQPVNGGFLEATPLTAFVVMSLTAGGQRDSEVVSKGTAFLVDSVREDGSWPIDTNLATWLTTLSVNALASAPDFEQVLPPVEQEKIRRMLLSSQYREEHPYTHAAPGGWAWMNLPGAVPDADDTAGALIALGNLGPLDEQVTAAAVAGLEWLLGLQNSDGGIPTFCRGWAALPFDRSAPDLTAHALGAFGIWADRVPDRLRGKLEAATRRGLDYLRHAQGRDGSWVPLWFGNQSAPNQANPVYGTARVLTGLQRLSSQLLRDYTPMLEKAAAWLLSAQNADGGWGGTKSVESSVEETALAVDALTESLLGVGAGTDQGGRSPEAIQSAVCGGVKWLIEKTEQGTSIEASPIGLYFARLWYYEELYPVIFALSALQKATNILGVT